MKVYIEPTIPDFAILRIRDALEKYVTKEHEIVKSEDEADLILIYAFGQRRRMQHRANHILAKGKKYAVMQLCLRGTPNPNTKDWLPLWQKANLVWSYYDLFELCQQDGTEFGFDFYHSPLGVDPEVFKEVSGEKKFIIANTGNGKPWNKECKNEVMLAAKELGKPIFHIGIGETVEGEIVYSNGMDDRALAEHYSQCDFVSGLRRQEGFELPILEGLLCGARPITFDKPHYRNWFGSLVEYIPEDHGMVTENVAKLLKKDPRPVTEAEKEEVHHKFNWETIITEFWNRLS